MRISDWSSDVCSSDLVKRGYSIQVDSLSRVIDRIVSAVDEDRARDVGRSVVIAGLLREVDPALIVDGMEVTGDHEPEEAGCGNRRASELMAARRRRADPRDRKSVGEGKSGSVRVN